MLVSFILSKKYIDKLTYKSNLRKTKLLIRSNLKFFASFYYLRNIHYLAVGALCVEDLDSRMEADRLLLISSCLRTLASFWRWANSLA